MYTNNAIQVTRNKIWSDIIRNENKTYESRFKIKEYTPPKSLKIPVSMKPTQMNPSKFLDDVRRKDEEDRKRKAEKKSKEESKDEVEEDETKYLYSSISKEYGQDWEEGMNSRKKFERWLAPLGTCEETRYADSFHTMTGKSPFAKNL